MMKSRFIDCVTYVSGVIFVFTVVCFCCNVNTDAQVPTNMLVNSVESGVIGQRRIRNQYSSGDDQHFIGGIKLEGSSGIAVNASITTALLYGKQLADESGITILDPSGAASVKLNLKSVTGQLLFSGNGWISTGTASTFTIRSGTGDIRFASATYPYPDRIVFDMAASPSSCRILMAEDATNSFGCGVSADAKWGFDGTNLLYTLTSGALRVGDNTDYSQMSNGGDVSFGGAGGFYPRRVSQSAEPANGTGSTQIDVGEQIFWHDTDDGKVYLMYNDTDTGVVKIELN